MTQNKLYNKHLFFISKDLNWDTMPEQRKYDRVHGYVMSVKIPTNKRQDLARKLHYLKLHDGITPTSSELLELAIGVTIN